MLTPVMVMVAALPLARPGPLPAQPASQDQELSKEKYLLDNLKTEVADYLTELNLVTTEDAGLLLAMPGHKADLLRNVNLSVSGDSHRTVANLMLVGAAGYLLSFLPRHVFTPLLPSLESAQAALLADRDGTEYALVPDYGDYVEPESAASFIHPFAVPPRHRQRRRKETRREEGFFERIGNQIKSFFWSEEKGASVKKDLSEELEVEAREPRFETVGYENYDAGDYVDGASEKAAQEETEEDIGFFKKVEKAIASFFLDNPLARASDEGGIGSFVDTMTDIWTDNFSWDYGRFSPKNILVPSDEKVRRDEERKLQEKSEQEDADTLYDEVFDSANYDDHYMHIHMKADSSQKAEVVAPYTTLMTDSLSPPPPPPLQLL